MVTREDIIAKAREYIDTKFVDQGRLKGVGVDCAGLPACVATDLGLQSNVFRAYKRQATIKVIDEQLRKCMRPILPAQHYRPGNLVVLSNAYQPNLYHLAIWTGTGIIHASDKVKKVVEVSADEDFVNSRLMASYAFLGVED